MSWLKKMPSLRPIIMATKLLLSQRGMSEVFSGGLGSFSVICMAISHFQVSLAMDYQTSRLADKGVFSSIQRSSDKRSTLHGTSVCSSLSFSSSTERTLATIGLGSPSEVEEATSTSRQEAGWNLHGLICLQSRTRMILVSDLIVKQGCAEG